MLMFAAGALSTVVLLALIATGIYIAAILGIDPRQPN